MACENCRRARANVAGAVRSVLAGDVAGAVEQASLAASDVAAKASGNRVASRWHVPREWGGELAFILGGGPSLNDVDVDAIRGRGRVIAVNNAYLRAPWADVLFWSDARWFEWNWQDLHRFEGRYRVTRNPPSDTRGIDVLWTRGAGAETFSTVPRKIGGHCSGAAAINMAHLFGARAAVLLGFDMRGGNWHDLHQVQSPAGHHERKIIPAMNAIAKQINDIGFPVLNATPGTALECFPVVTLDDILSGAVSI